MNDTERIQRILEDISLLNLCKLAQSADGDLATLAGDIYEAEMNIRGKWYDLQDKLEIMERAEKDLKSRETLSAIREIHDTIKNHPYFDGFSPSASAEVFSLIRRMEEVFYSSPLCNCEETDNLVHYSTPQAALICGMCHDVNEGMIIVSCYRGEIGSYIVQTNSFVSLFHSLVEGKEQTKAWVNLDNYKSYNKYKVLRAVYIKNKGWHRTIELKRVNKGDEIRRLEDVVVKQMKGLRSVSVVSSALRCLEDIEQETNKYYTITD